jgi:pimeloyl-ACP methyl ester carboxylesterase
MSDPIPAWPGELVELPCGEVFVRAAPAEPDAQPATFVHGLGGSSTNWTDLIAELRQGPGQVLGCEALDLPGFGFSPVPADRDYSINARAAAVAELIEQRRNWPVHLIGNSLGGAVCTRVAARRPDLVRTLTLISPALPDLKPRLLPLRLTVACAPGFGPWLLSKAREVPPQRRSEIVLRDCYADPSRMPPQRLLEEAAELARRDGLGYAEEVLIGSARSLMAEYTTRRRGSRSLWHDAQMVTAPTLVIHGSHDRLVNPAMAARAARAFRNGRVIVLPRTGHVAMMERPAQVAQEIRALLASAGDRLARVAGG